MATSNGLPDAEIEFNAAINTQTNYINTNKARLVLTVVAQGYLTQLLALLNTAPVNWNATWALYDVPSTKTDTVVANKISLRPQIETLFHGIIADIPFSALTPADRKSLNLPLPAGTHTSATKPTSTPSITVTKHAHLSVTISILEVEHGYTITNVDDAASIEIDTAFLAPNIAESSAFPTETDFRLLEITTHSNVIRSYTPPQLKGTEYIRARYLSSRNEPGNWSEVITVVVA